MENAESGASLLTQFATELESARSYGFSPDSFLAFKTSTKPDVGVWRMYNSRTGDFTWSADGADLKSLVGTGYEKQFAQFNASSVDSACLSAGHRLLKGDVSRIVVGDVDRDESVRDGWKLPASGLFSAVPAKSVQPASFDPGQERPVAAVVENEFRFAVIPDTQQETWSDSGSDSRFRNRPLWLAENAKPKI